MPDPIRSYYQDNLPDLSSLTDLTRRHFRILLPSGTFLKVQDRIRDGATLQQWLVRYRPSDVYYSTSCWLSPENIGSREKTPLSANIFLSSEIVFDIDRSPFSLKKLELAHKDTLDLLAFCEKRDFQIKYIAFSGSKGFHVICSDPH
jgi:DNA primase catalytic subunit